MEQNGKHGRPVSNQPTMLLIVCTRCLALRKETLGRANTVCGCGGRRRIVRVIHDDPVEEWTSGGRQGAAKRGGANRGGPNGGRPGRSTNGRS